MSDENRIKKVSWCEVFSNLLSVVIFSVWANYYLRDWNKLDEKLKGTTTSTLLFCYMIIIFISLFESCKKLIISRILLGTEMTEKQLQNAYMFNSKIIKFINGLVEFAEEIIMIMMVWYFIPFTKKNCYEYSESMCTYGRFGAFFGMIYLILFCICIFVLVVYVLFVCVDANRRTRFRQVVNNRLLNNIIQRTSLKYLEIFDTECAICLEDGTEGDNKFVELECKHQFHLKCIQTFLNNNLNPTCPNCRAPINRNLPAITGAQNSV